MSESPYISLRSGLDHLLIEHALDCVHPHPARVFFDKQRISSLQRLVAKITYRDWKVVVCEDDRQAWIQIQTFMDDSKGTGLMYNNSRHVFLCAAMDDAFIQEIAERLIVEFEMHEAAEFFRVDGEQVYFPHAPTGQPVQSVLALRHRRAGEIPAS